jgi:hypothetical protein
LVVLSLTPIAALLRTPARRLLVWLALPAVCVAVVASVLLLWQGAVNARHADAEVLLKLADKQAQLSASRLEAANDLASTLLGEDIGPQGQLLAGLIDGSEVFSRAAVLDAQPQVTTPWNRSLHLNRVQLATLAGGGGVLLSLPDDASRATLALLRAAPGESRKRMVVFELKADFWWADAQALPADVRVGVFDSRGLSVAGMALPTGLMSRLMTIAHLSAVPVELEWQSANEDWDGALALVAPAITAKPPLLQLVSSLPHRAWFHYLGDGLATLPLLLLGFGHGLLNPPALAGTVGVVPALAGSAAAVAGLMQQLTGATGGYLVGLVSHEGAVNLGWMMLAFSLLAVCAQWVLHRR